MCTSANDVKRRTVMDPEADYYLLHLLQYCTHMYEEFPQNKAPSSFLSQYLFPNHGNYYTPLRLMVLINTLFFHKESIHFHSLKLEQN